MRAAKGDEQDGARTSKSYKESGQPPEDGQQDAFGDDLADESRAGAAQRRPDSGLKARGGAARQQQIGDVGAGDQEHQAGDRHEEAQARLVVALQVGHAPAGGREDDVLLAEL